MLSTCQPSAKHMLSKSQADIDEERETLRLGLSPFTDVPRLSKKEQKVGDYPIGAGPQAKRFGGEP